MRRNTRKNTRRTYRSSRFKSCAWILDALVDLLIQIVHKIQVRAEGRVEQEYVTQLKRIAGKDTILYYIAEAAVEHPDDPVRKVVFPVASETLLQDLIKEYKSKGPAFR